MKPTEQNKGAEHNISNNMHATVTKAMRVWHMLHNGLSIPHQEVAADSARRTSHRPAAGADKWAAGAPIPGKAEEEGAAG